MSIRDFLVGTDQSFDNLINGGSQQVFQALATPSAEFLTLLAGAALAVWAITAGFRGSFSLDGFIMFAFRFTLFYLAISGGALWTQYIFPFITQFPVNVGNTIISSFGGTGNAGGVATAFADVAETSFDNIVAALGSYGVTDYIAGDALGVLLFALLAAGAILAMIIIALALLIASKVLLAILLAIFPVLAVWAYLRSSAEIFNGWVRGITMLVLFQVLLFGVMGISLAATGDVSQAVSNGVRSGTDVPLEMFKLAGISGITAGLLLICPMIAQRIGGAALNLGESQIKGVGATGMKLLGGQLTGGGSGGNNLGDVSNQRASAANEADRPSATETNNQRIQDSVRRGAERMAEDARRRKS
ncbi:type IV secretion system protein [Ruegeria sp. Alg231-54]|uniref:type IV secretion system protein n=1 Tax=Ruegeria sp. Alg231-54 TaxID=1922221 RepID=UPI000D5520FF|nr:type IV secretion system protein [Ruegeria sp. Alg231-54]